MRKFAEFFRNLFNWLFSRKAPQDQKKTFNPWEEVEKEDRVRNRRRRRKFGKYSGARKYTPAPAIQNKF